VRIILALLALSGLPDLDQAAPYGVSVRMDGARPLLTFASAVDNMGAAPLVVESRRRGRFMDAWQVVGGRRVPVGRLVFVRAETHAHWHLLGFERYELRTPGGRLVRAAPKRGFCLGDRYDARASARLPGEPARAVFRGECGKGRPNLLRLRQGISIGYGDDYVPRLEGQWIDVTGVRDGRYVLVHRADPDGHIVQRTRANDASSALVELRGRTVRVLRRCADSGTCGPR
jgi:hypothetical protein